VLWLALHACGRPAATGSCETCVMMARVRPCARLHIHPHTAAVPETRCTTQWLHATCHTPETSRLLTHIVLSPAGVLHCIKSIRSPLRADARPARQLLHCALTPHPTEPMQTSYATKKAMYTPHKMHSFRRCWSGRNTAPKQGAVTTPGRKCSLIDSSALNGEFATRQPLVPASMDPAPQCR